MEAHLAPNPPVQVNKITYSCEICSGPYDTHYFMENPEQAFVDYASSHTDEARGKWFTFKPEQNNLGDTYNPSWKSHPNLRLEDGTKSYTVGIVRNVEVHIGKLKLLEDFYVIDMEKDPATPLLVGRGFLATASVAIDCNKSKIAVGKGITSTDGIGARPPYYAKKYFVDCHFPGEWESARDAALNPFKDVLLFRKMIEVLGTIPINPKGNTWESEELIKKRIDWNRPPKEGDGAWHIRIKLIDPDEEKFNKTF
uniref:MAK10-like protein n=1 Tax=Tanacetum cinerariifolium TaxID=118510 RepID=A0A6L2M1L8_TANCI|nr:MAK10-like protein [Tanacetum cinerariifolium]